MTDLERLAYSAAVLLAVVLVWAAVAKLRSPLATRDSFAQLGLARPDSLARTVPLTELATACMLVGVPFVGGLGALALLGAFTTFLVVAIRRGVEAGCSCFGSARNEAVSYVEVIRNAGLMVLAGLAVFAGSPGWPGLGAIVVVSVAATCFTATLAALDLRRRTGTFWRIGADAP